MRLDPDDVTILWAAMIAMVYGNHAPQDFLTAEQWVQAEAILAYLTDMMDEITESGGAR